MKKNKIGTSKKSIWAFLINFFKFSLTHFIKRLKHLFFDKIVVRLHKGKLIHYFILNKRICSRIKTNDSTRFILPFYKIKKQYTYDAIFLLKVNRMEPYSFKCIQHWINAITRLGADYYFICDNKYLKKDILRKIKFPNEDIKFIGSRTWKAFYFAENLFTAYWRKAAYANMTSFLQAKKVKAKYFWTIDADDTMFVTNPSNVALILDEAKKKSIDENIAVLSLDMWRTRTKGKHWSFGVTFVQNEYNWLSIFESILDKSWTNKYKDYDVSFNMDWFFNYIKDEYALNIKNFYVENCLFIHWGCFLHDPIVSGVYLWKAEKLFLPITYYIFRNKDISIFDIHSSCINIDINLDEKDSYHYLMNKISNLILYPQKLKKLNDFNVAKLNNLSFLD